MRKGILLLFLEEDPVRRKLVFINVFGELIGRKLLQALAIGRCDESGAHGSCLRTQIE